MINFSFFGTVNVYVLIFQTLATQPLRRFRSFILRSNWTKTPLLEAQMHHSLITMLPFPPAFFGHPDVQLREARWLDPANARILDMRYGAQFTPADEALAVTCLHTSNAVKQPGPTALASRTSLAQTGNTALAHIVFARLVPHSTIIFRGGTYTGSIAPHLPYPLARINRPLALLGYGAPGRVHEVMVSQRLWCFAIPQRLPAAFFYLLSMPRGGQGWIALNKRTRIHFTQTPTALTGDRTYIGPLVKRCPVDLYRAAQ